MRCNPLLWNPRFPGAILLGNSTQTNGEYRTITLLPRNPSCPHLIFGPSCMEHNIHGLRKHDKKRHGVLNIDINPYHTVISNQSPLLYSISDGFKTMEGQTDANCDATCNSIVNVARGCPDQARDRLLLQLA